MNITFDNISFRNDKDVEVFNELLAPTKTVKAIVLDTTLNIAHIIPRNDIEERVHFPFYELVKQSNRFELHFAVEDSDKENTIAIFDNGHIGVIVNEYIKAPAYAQMRASFWRWTRK